MKSIEAESVKIPPTASWACSSVYCVIVEAIVKVLAGSLYVAVIPVPGTIRAATLSSTASEKSDTDDAGIEIVVLEAEVS